MKKNSPSVLPHRLEGNDVHGIADNALCSCFLFGNQIVKRF